MLKISSHLSLVTTLIAFAGCATTLPISRYPISAENVRTLRERKMDIAAGEVKYSAPAEKNNELWCRQSVLQPADGAKVTEYFRRSLADEISMAGRPETNSVSIDLKKVDVQSVGGKWVIESVVSVDGKSKDVNFDFDYPTQLLDGGGACRSAATTFPDAVQGYLGQVYKAVAALEGK